MWSEGMADEEFEATTKLDGMSCIVFFHNGTTGVCSRNAELDTDAATPGPHVRASAPAMKALAGLGRNIAIQGEVMGLGIQKNREGLTAPTLFVFDIWDVAAQAPLPPAERRAICDRLQLKHVPVLHTAIAVREAYATVNDVLAYADGVPSLRHPISEGVVYISVSRPAVSFKAISNKFLLKSGS